jgi:hypothetical protein
MNRQLCPAGGFWAVALLLTASPIAAQTPPPTTPPNVAAPQPSPDPKTAPPSAPVTLTGCLERSKPPSVTDAGRTQTPPSADPATSFVLRTDATPASTDRRGVVYKIIASGTSVKLDQHVGHRVEVTGTLQLATNQQPALSNQGVSPSTRSGSTGMETIPSPATASSGDTPSVTQPIFVESLKMIDATCKAATQ